MDARAALCEIWIGVFTDNPQLGALLQACLRALDVRHVTLISDPMAPEFAALVSKCDVGIVSLNAAGLGLLHRLRRAPTSPNRYLPVLAVSVEPTMPDIQAALGWGAHDVLRLPASEETLAQRLTAAVLVGRPFIETPAYFGPCRRRALVNAPPTPVDRRQNAEADLARRRTQARNLRELLSRSR